MSKLKVQIKLKVQMTELTKEKILTFCHFVIHLTFACLPVGRDFDI
jgi:hypothetical protein